MKLPLALLCASLCTGQDTATVIRVVRADEGWLLGTRKLKAGEALSAKAELKGTRATPLVLACTADLWLSYTCKEDGCRVRACSTESGAATVQPIHMKPSGTAAGKDGARGDPLASLLRRQRDDPRIAGVRGGGNPNDAVVLQSGDAVHWGPALTRVLEGRYCFRISRLPAGEVRTFTLEWDRSAEPEGIAPLSSLPPGVYGLEKGDASCRFTDADSAPAWVVVAPEARFAEVNGAWNSYTASFKELSKGGASPAVVSTVRRAILSSLGDSLEKK